MKNNKTTKNYTESRKPRKRNLWVEECSKRRIYNQKETRYDKEFEFAMYSRKDD